ncbi:MAG: ABC transporter permease [Candidatus Rehaiarchaeum fermentans]|nr:ABC transporter permease [Candidatus Rehaiarchaeum fermentans]
MRIKTVISIFLHDKRGLAGFIIIMFFLVLSIIVQLGGFGIKDPNSLVSDENVIIGPEPPGPGHVLGTTYLGIDVLKAILKGTKTDVFFSIPSILIAMLLGLFFGIIAGYYGGIIDEIMMRITDIVFAIPFLILLILFISINSNIFTQFLVLSIAFFPIYAKYVRVETLKLRRSPIVLSSKAMGNSDFKIIIYKIVPRVIYIALAQVPLTFGALIGAFATVSYINYSNNPTIPELGYIAGQSLQFFNINPWATLLPSIIITILAIGFNLLTLGIRKAIDPREIGIWESSH